MGNELQARRTRALALLFMLLWCSLSHAGHDRWTQEELALLPKVAALEQRPRLSAEDLSVLQTGFESRLDRIRIAAIRVILLQRQSMRNFWQGNSKSRPVRGTSAQLLPIVDAALAPGVDPQRLLIDVAPKQALEALPKAGTTKPRRPPIVDGDDPLDDALLNILVDDAIRRASGTAGAELLRKFDAYRLAPEQRTRLAQATK